jgi:hypothetical protein
MNRKNPNSCFELAVFLLLFTCFSFVFYRVFDRQVPVASFQGGQLIMSDFCYHLLLVRDYWAGHISNIYSYPEQLQALQNFTGKPIVHAMPVGMSPTALLIWLPFAQWAGHDLTLACALWSALSLSVFSIAVLRLLAISAGAVRRQLSVCIAVVACSSAGLSALLLGQTSILAAGIFLLLLPFLVEKRELPLGLLFVGLFLLSLKLPYLLIAAGLLLAYRRSLLSSASAFGIVLLAGAVVAPHMLPDYWRSLQMYSSGVIPDHYQASLVPERTNTLSAALLGIMNWQQARQLSAGLGAVAFSITALVLVTLCLHPAGRRDHRTAPAWAAAVFFIFLCLTPYAGAFEDMLLLPPVALMLLEASRRNDDGLSPRHFISLVLSLLILANFTISPGMIPAELLFSLKLFCAVFIFQITLSPCSEAANAE